MAEVPVTINGVIYPKAKGGTMRPTPVTIVGSAWVTGLGVGGGPIVPPDQPPPVDGNHPAHPIVLPPTDPVVPPEIPQDPTVVKPPPPEGGWGWSPQYGWGYFPG